MPLSPKLVGAAVPGGRPGRLRGDGRADDEVPGGRDAVSPPPRPTASSCGECGRSCQPVISSFEGRRATIDVADGRGEPAVDISLLGDLWSSLPRKVLYHSC